MKAFVLAVVLFPGVALAAEVPYHAQPYKHHGVSLQAEKVFLKKDKLWVRLIAINETSKILTMDKAPMRVRTASGATVPREAGTFGKNPKAQVMQPGTSHPLYVEFVIGEAPQAVDLLLEHGFIVDGKPLALPPLELKPGA